MAPEACELPKTDIEGITREEIEGKNPDAPIIPESLLKKPNEEKLFDKKKLIEKPDEKKR